ncbi:MAG: hypothetical protein E6J78_15735 [Deltaproteobacteria bacterium]|nr:MAG: hypothetical protein E6J78_15735 [Deltaproteobacteria bacterium]
MKLTVATVASALVCLLSLAERSRRAAQLEAQPALSTEERIALASVDESLRKTLRRLVDR